MRSLAGNQFTTPKWSFEEDVQAYAAAGFQGIGVVRDKAQAYGIEAASALLKEHDLKITELCVAGFFTETDADAFQTKVSDARQAIDMAAQLEADVLILLAGPPGNRTFEENSALLRRGLEEILPAAEQHHVRLALEPVHPMYRAGYSFIVTLSEALDVCETVGSSFLGVWLDMYHLWWDNSVLEQIDRASGRILGVHINDFKEETLSLIDQGVPGEGVIPLRRMLDAIEKTGWEGMYAIEIFCERTAVEGYHDVLRRCREGFTAIWE